MDKRRIPRPMDGRTRSRSASAFALDVGEQMGLRSVDRHVLLVLATRMFNLPTEARRDHDACWPSVDWLAKVTGYHRRTIFSSIERLAKAGVLAVDRSSRSVVKGKVRHSNVYRLVRTAGEVVLDHRDEDRDDEGADRGVAVEHQDVAVEHREVAVEHKGGGCGSPEVIRRSSKEKLQQQTVADIGGEAEKAVTGEKTEPAPLGSSENNARIRSEDLYAGWLAIRKEALGDRDDVPRLDDREERRQFQRLREIVPDDVLLSVLNGYAGEKKAYCRNQGLPLALLLKIEWRLQPLLRQAQDYVARERERVREAVELREERRALLPRPAPAANIAQFPGGLSEWTVTLVASSGETQAQFTVRAFDEATARRRAETECGRLPDIDPFATIDVRPGRQAA